MSAGGGGGGAGAAAVARGGARIAGPAGSVLARARAWSRTTALLLGALTAAALPPVHAWPLLLAFAGLLHLIRHGPRPHDALLVGWCFGFGYFLAGLYWVGIAFFVEAERFGPLAVPAVLGLCAFLAAFPALAAWLVSLRRWRSTAAAALALAVAWTGAEVAREWITAFPWNLIGYAWAGSEAVSQLAALTGAYGLSLLTVAVASLPATLLEPGGAGDRGRRLAPPLAGALALALVWAGGHARLAAAGDDVETVPAVRLRLVQANVAQHHKWDPELRARWFQRHLELSTAGNEGITHVVWPESATPYVLGRDAEARRLIGEAAPEGGLVLTGANRYDFETVEPYAVWNSLQAVDDAGRVVAHYDKVDLVPFGEFLPFRSVLGRLGLDGLAAGSVDFGRGPGRLTLDLPGGLPPFGALICYEVAFPGHAVDRDDRPDWILNVTNDGWFGTSSGPYQHFAMARMRAIEEGLPLVRAANTGISAVVDGYGRVRARLGLNETGVLDADLPRPLAPTAYAQLGPAGPLALAALLALLAAAAEYRRRNTGAASRGDGRR